MSLTGWWPSKHAAGQEDSRDLPGYLRIGQDDTRRGAVIGNCAPPYLATGTPRRDSARRSIPATLY